MASQTYKLFGGAMGGGKSFWLCQEALLLSMQYPGNRGVICRYHLSDFKNSTLKTLLEVIPQDLIANHNRAENCINLVNGSEIIYMGLSEQENVSKLKSMELGWFAIDEASEVPKDNFLLFQSRLRRKLPNGVFPKFFGLLASNPADCWLKDDFVLNGGGEDYLFIPSLPKDNPHLPHNYEENLRKSFPAEWVQRFLEGSWDDLEGGDTLIQMQWIRESVNREVLAEEKPCVSVDIARFGEDETVIQYGKGYQLIEQEVFTRKSLMETVGRLVTMRKSKDARLVVTDDIGVGGGVTDRLKEMGEPVLPINCGVPSEDARYANLKTEMWWFLRGLFQDSKISLINDPVLIRQLASVKYGYKSNGKIFIEPKEDTKARLGSSPDRADALVLLMWGMKFIVDASRDYHREDYEPAVVNDPYGWQNIQQAANSWGY